MSTTDHTSDPIADRWEALSQAVREDRVSQDMLDDYAEHLGRELGMTVICRLIEPACDEAEQAAGWLFIQWLTSKEKAGQYLDMGGVPARKSAYADPALAAKFKFIPALVESWQEGVPEFRPRFAEWPAITEIVQEWGTKMMLGEVSVEEGSKMIGQKMEEVLAKAGYYDGKKPLVQ